MCKRRKILVNGIVQGVGFRPFIFNLAHDYKLTGLVSNTSEGVVIEAEGGVETLDQFQTAIRSKAPPLAFITDVAAFDIPTVSAKEFVIMPSDSQARVATMISPDIAVCEDCLQDLRDPANHRYRYPFTNCTNCGPRYTIIEELPYDRSFTSMSHFKMCPDCQAEYEEPTDRRFHAQPNACPVCGPKLALFTIDRKPVVGDDLIRETACLLKTGSILAIKGLGGFHLVVDAANSTAVIELRRRKNREEKPLAVMVKDLAAARNICELITAEEELLASPRAPIILAHKRPGSGLADEIAPGNDRLGVMLPYTPLHHLLLAEEFTALVMTSANLSEEPICIANDESFERLQEIADYVLIHDRDIYLRSDDSVFIHLAGRNRPVRRSRGYAPMPVLVKSEGPPILAVGGELKNTVCLLQNNRAFVSQHIGDLENLEAYNFFRMTIDHLQKVFDTKPELIVHDLHPRYLSTQWAQEQIGVPLLGVQHHHAHLAAVMAEHGIEEQVLGIIMDGTGYSNDGTIWGGEILLGDYSGYQRVAAFEPMPLPGGDAAIKAPWRTAVSYLLQSEGELPALPFLSEHDYKPIVDMVEKNVSCFATSSCGRLFDAVAAMSGGRQIIHYEGQAAIELMQLSDNVSAKPFKYEFSQQGNLELMLVKPLIRAVVQAIKSGCELSEIGSRFHRTLCDMLSTIVKQLRRKHDINTVVVSGGVFQNQILFEALIKELKKEKFVVLSHEKVPTNDGGIALGQALIGRKYLEKLR